MLAKFDVSIAPRVKVIHKFSKNFTMMINFKAIKQEFKSILNTNSLFEEVNCNIRVNNL